MLEKRWLHTTNIFVINLIKLEDFWWRFDAEKTRVNACDTIFIKKFLKKVVVNWQIVHKTQRLYVTV